MNKRKITLMAGLLAGVVLALGLVTQAFAHADYESSTPGDGETVTTAPTQVSAVFSADLDATGTNGLNVTNSASADVDNNDVAIGPANSMTITLQANLPNGTYTVAWNTTSAEDGETDEGTFSFTINAQVAPSATTPATTPADATPEATSAADELPSSGRSATAGGEGNMLMLLTLGIAAGGLMLAGLGLAGATRRHRD
jgi:methionine-rich copper-binding protein CopC